MMSAAGRLSRSLPSVRGRGRLALTLHQHLRFSGERIAVPMRRGTRMVVPANSAQTWRAAFTGGYDEDEIEMLLAHFDHGSFALDVGASLGFYAVALGAHARTIDGLVVAVEPITQNCKVLLENVAINGLDDTVFLLPVALGSTRADVVFHVETGGTGNAAIVSGLPLADIAAHDRAGGTGSVSQGEVVPLDELALPSQVEDRRCSLIKIDAEGYEMDILRGSSTFIERNRPVIFAEFSPAWFASRGVPTGAPQEWAADAGYACYEVGYRRQSPFLDRQKVTLHKTSLLDGRTGSSLLLIPEEAAVLPGT